MKFTHFYTKNNTNFQRNIEKNMKITHDKKNQNRNFFIDFSLYSQILTQDNFISRHFDLEHLSHLFGSYSIQRQKYIGAKRFKK